LILIFSVTLRKHILHRADPEVQKADAVATAFFVMEFVLFQSKSALKMRSSAAILIVLRTLK